MTQLVLFVALFVFATSLFVLGMHTISRGLLALIELAERLGTDLLRPRERVRERVPIA